MALPIIKTLVQRTSLLFGLAAIQVTGLCAQQYYSKTARVVFVSQAPLEKIEASNSNAFLVFDAATGNIELSVLIKGFQFSKALMQDHFNENYMESHKYPKGIFKGRIQNGKDYNLQKDGDYTVSVSGTLTLHGVSKPMTTNGQITVKGGQIAVRSVFDLTVADYHIDIPKVVRDNIARTVNVRVNADLQPLH